ncbi:unnamed protein product, partial [Laminaria digitata]
GRCTRSGEERNRQLRSSNRIRVVPVPIESTEVDRLNWGVRMVRKSVVADRGGHVKQEWVCMASHACRQVRKRLVITSAQTSNATQHLSQVHKLKSAKAKAMKITKDRPEDKVQTSLTSTLYQDDPER